MPKYAYVEGTKVAKVYDSLPTSWNNISNFNLLESNTNQLNKYNWYVVQENIPEYDSKKFKLSQPNYELSGNVVIANYSLISIQPDSPAELQRRFMILVRSKRDQLLKETDWTMMPDVTKTKTPEWVTAWENYRQALREYPAQFQYEIDDTPVDFKILIWPSIPNL